MQTIVYVHKGNPFYLRLSIEQARKSNPNAIIILLGDESNSTIKNVKHFYVKDYFNRAAKFDNIYENYSPNSRNYELFCFQRWMVIWEFQQQHPEYNDGFVYCDSDTLLFDDVIYDLNQLGDSPLALEGIVGPAFTFFNKGTLSNFCDTIEWFYITKEGKDYLSRFIEEKHKRNAIHGFSDMYAFEYYVNNVRQGEVIDAQLDCRGGWNRNCQNPLMPLFRYDQNVNFKEDFELTKKGIKRFSFKNGKPYAYSHRWHEDVLFKGIHFQGKAKYEMIKFCNVDIPLLGEYWYQYHIIYSLKKFKKHIWGIKRFLYIFNKKNQ